MMRILNAMKQTFFFVLFLIGAAIVFRLILIVILV